MEGLEVLQFHPPETALCAQVDRQTQAEAFGMGRSVSILQGEAEEPLYYCAY